jgi:hypothetical protein
MLWQVIDELLVEIEDVKEHVVTNEGLFCLNQILYNQRESHLVFNQTLDLQHTLLLKLIVTLELQCSFSLVGFPIITKVLWWQQLATWLWFLFRLVGHFNISVIR